MPSDYANRDLIVRSWHVRHDQAAEIAATADDLGTGHSAVVRYLLDHALTDLRAGRLQPNYQLSHLGKLINHALTDLRAGRLQLRTQPTRWVLLDYRPPGK